MVFVVVGVVVVAPHVVVVPCGAVAAVADGNFVVAVGIVNTVLDIAAHVAAVVEDKPELYIADAVHSLLWKLAKVEEIQWKFSSSFQIETGKTRMVKKVVSTLALVLREHGSNPDVLETIFLFCFLVVIS